MDRDKLIQELKRDEGVKLKAYTDTVGKRTVGIGRNFEDVPFSREECHKIFGTTSITFHVADKILSTRGLTMEQAEYLLSNDIDKCVDQLSKQPFWSAVAGDDNRSRALVNMCFNLGINGLLGFKNTLGFIAKKDWKNAANNLTQSKWFGQVGDRAKRIILLIDPTFYDKPIEPKIVKPTAIKPALQKAEAKPATQKVTKG